MTQLENITHNVYAHCGKAVERVQGDIDRDVHAYFFRHLIPYRHGAQQAIVNFMIKRLYEACIDAGIDGVYDPDDDEALRVLKLLNQMNFNGENVKKPRTKKVKE